MKKILIFLPLCSLFMVGCGNETNTNKSSQPEIYKISKHTITLNASNYLKYFDIEKTTNYAQTTYVIKGCLSYALYENVVFKLKYYDTSLYNEFNTPLYESYSTNLAGNLTIPGTSKYGSSIAEVSGTVTYLL